MSEEVTAQLYSPLCYRVRWLFMWMSELHFISVIYARDVQYNLRDKLPSTNLQILRVTSWQCAAETGARRRAQEIRDKCDRGRLFVWNMTVMTRDGTKLRLWRCDSLHVALTRKNVSYTCTEGKKMCFTPPAFGGGVGCHITMCTIVRHLISPRRSGAASHFMSD